MIRLFAAAVVGAVVLIAAGVAAASPSRQETFRPTVSAIHYWKTHLIAFARRDLWWKGYLSAQTGYRFASCRFDSRGVLTYGCTLEDGIGGTTLAFVGLVRFSACGYGYTLAPVQNPQHQLTRAFRYC